MKNRTLFIILSIVMLLVPMSARGHNYPYEIKPQDVQAKDTTRVLCIGNSFTYVFDTHNVLAEIAWSQGHFIKARAAYVGGYSFACHLADPKTLRAIENLDGYQVVFLQNQSSLNALYAIDSVRFRLAAEDAVKLAERVRMYSPDARLFFEATWASPKIVNAFSRHGERGFETDDPYVGFDRLMWTGTSMMARDNNAEASPIGRAFALVRTQNPQISLLSTDKHHQSMAGAYLKACVNYLMIFGGQFSKKTSCCGLEPSVAKVLQEAAMRTVEQYGRN